MSAHVVGLDALLTTLRAAAATTGRTPAVLGVDGHSSSGKTTLSGRLAAALGTVVVHTDDLCWYDAAFGYDHLLVDGVITPFRSGAEVGFRPPQWELRGRAGAVTVPAGLPWLVVEGVACTRPRLRSHYDAAVWVETETAIRLARDEVRVAAGEISPAGYRAWMTEEDAVIDTETPRQGADAVVIGDGTLPCGPDEVVLAG